MWRLIAIRVLASALGIALLDNCGGGGGGGPAATLTPTLTIMAASPPAGTTGTAYAGYAFTASGGTAPFSWRESGSLPPGLQLSPSGQLSGNPGTAGTYPISVTVTDSSVPPLTASADVSLKINDSAIVIATAVPQSGYVGYRYNGLSFSASGGSPPYSWHSGGTLPPGLVLASNGALSGTPTRAGSFSFSVTATDSAKPPTSAPPLTAQIVISTPPPPPTIDNQEPLTGTVGSEYLYQFTASNGVAPLAWSAAPSLTMGLSLGTQGLLWGTPTSAGQFSIMLDVADALNRAVPSTPMTVRVSQARPPGGFSPTGHLGIPRAGHSATLLVSGKVLVAGGGNGAPDATAELYDPAAGTFSPTAGNMMEARSGHTATLLNLSSPSAPNYGKVLILGSGDKTAELYDPAANTFAATGSMNRARTSPTATLLNTGKVLIVGGSTTANDLTAELYDPVSGTFSYTGSTAIARNGHTATLLPDGRVLIAGGGTDTAELYDPAPASGKFSMTAGTMSEPRSGHTATLLGSADDVQNGFVLIIGGDGTAELYDPSKESFAAIGSLVPAMRPSYLHTASLLSDGTVLAAGGYNFTAGCGQAPSAENAAARFAPESDGFTATESLFTARDTHTATVLEDGTVLIVGGMQHVLNSSGPPPQCVTSLILSSAELYRIARQTNPPLTGDCWGSLNTQQCETIRDLTECPVGQPSIKPTAVSGGCWPPSGAYVDLSRLCTLGSHFGRPIHGYCVIR